VPYPSSSPMPLSNRGGTMGEMVKRKRRGVVCLEDYYARTKYCVLFVRFSCHDSKGAQTDIWATKKKGRKKVNYARTKYCVLFMRFSCLDSKGAQIDICATEKREGESSMY